MAEVSAELPRSYYPDGGAYAAQEVVTGFKKACELGLGLGCSRLGYVLSLGVLGTIDLDALAPAESLAA